jgi:signal transduction histidine kinase
MADQLISARSSRLVAYARVILAAFMLVSVLFGELRNAELQSTFRAVFSVYLAYSLLIVVSVWTMRLRRHLLHAALVLLIIDTITFSGLLYVTADTRGSFFTPLTFILLSATVQWGYRGAWWSGLLVIAVFLASGLRLDLLSPESGPARQLFLIRIGYLGMMSITLAAFAQHLERLVTELTRIARPISLRGETGEGAMITCLAHTLAVFGAERGVIVWADPEEPHLSIGRIDDGVPHVATLPGTDMPLVEMGQKTTPFLYDRVRGMSLYRANGRLQDSSGVALHPLLDRIDYHRALVIPIAATGADGLVMVLDPPDPANEDLMVATMISNQISLTMEAWKLQAERRMSAATDERVRLARDLHDGVLQFLAGSRLQLDLIARTQLSDEARQRVEQMRDAIAEEQRQLRQVIQAMRHGPTRGSTHLGNALSQVAEHLSKSWDADVSAHVVPSDVDVSEAMEEDIVRIAREAVANSVRHGGARRVSIEVRQSRDSLKIMIGDDGRGFPFEGEMMHDELAEFAGRPRSLHARVSAMGGRLTLASGKSGARLDISLPDRRAR